MSISNPRYPERRTLQLIESLIDDSIEEAAFAELVETLQQNPQALATYVDYVNMHSALRQNYLSHSYVDNDALDLNIGSDLRVELPGKVSRMEVWGKYLLTIAATLLLTSSLFFLRESPPDAADEASSKSVVSSELPGQAVESVAVLTRLVDVVWENDIQQASLDMPLPRQELRIKAGLMQIEFYCGAAVIIEGPAAFELVSPDRGFAHHGKLRAHVPARARGFTIGTKSGDVVDLGTEFGLDINEEGLSQLHVIDGEVDFHDSSNTTDPARRLVGGQAIEVASNGLLHRIIESDASRFVNHSELNARASKKKRGKFLRWQDYHTRLRSDPALVADYVFHDSKDWGRTLVNAAPKADEMSYGAIVGASWYRGRWPESKSLRFDSPSDRVRIKIDGTFDSLSLATWVNIQQLGERTQAIAILHPEIEYPEDDSPTSQRFIHWTLNPTDLGAVLHFAESTGHHLEGRNHYSSVSHGVRNADFGSWIHLAVVYDREAQEVFHYRDGELVGSKPIESPRPLGIGVADLCNWPYKGWAAGTQFEFRNMNGLMDEFVVLGRALAQEEIREMYEVGQP